MPMPNNGFPRIAIYGATIAHLDSETIVFLDSNNRHLLTVSLLGTYDKPFIIYHHERRKVEPVYATETLSDSHPIPFEGEPPYA